MNLAIREALLGVKRAPLLSALSVTTIAFSLFAFGLFGLVALNLRNALARIEERVEIRAFIAEGTPLEATSALVSDAQSFPEVLSATFVSTRDALQRARAELKEFNDVLEADILPASIDVRLKEGFRDPESVKRVAERLQAYQFVDDVRFGEDWVEKLYRLRNIAGVAGTTLGLVFAIVAMIIIGATIRMTVLARAKEISIMRLVGATDAFVRSPFLLEGFLKGVAGGLLALAMTYVAHRLMTPLIETSFFDVGTSLLGILGGAVIGLLGSAASVARHLRAE